MSLITERDKMGRILGVAREIPDATCLHCSKSFRVDRRGVKFCSNRCKFEIRDTQKHFEEYFWSRVNKSGDCWTWRGKSNGLHSEAWRRGKRVGAHRAAWEISNGPIPDGMLICHKCDNPPCVRPDHLFLGSSDDNNKDMAAKNRSSHGSRNSQAKLTEATALAIKIDYAMGLMPKAIAEKYQISNTTVCRIGMGKSWTRIVCDKVRGPSVIPEFCKRGHRWTPENTNTRGGKSRTCRTCMRERPKIGYQAAEKLSASAVESIPVAGQGTLL